MTVSVEIADPRTEPEPHGWSGFRAAGGLPAVWDYDLLALESWAARNPPLLLVVREGARIVAGATVLVCRPRLRPAYAAPPRRRGAPVPLWAEVYQPWLSGFAGVAFAEDVDEPGTAELLRRVERALAARLGPRLLGVLYRAVDTTLAAALAGRGRLVRQVDTVSVLANTFGGEDDWLGSLSKSRRSSVRRSLREVERRVASARLVIRGGPARDDLHGREIAALVNRHRAERGVPRLETRSPLLGSYFHRFVKRPDVHTLTYHDDEGRLLALNTMLENSRCLVKQHWAALPPADGGVRHLLFDSYARAVRHMVSAGVAELSAGRRPHDVKRSLGFAPRPVYGVAVPRPVMGR
ncbi:hypothetical protein FFT09_06880 [Saccharomonospora piscinae]|uniref:hypothetical protein n=1 Tax=Saccharomonospora piscinae TaxID=687388 RepID=UPI0011060F7A|nr:hypothetical protein [Saccharomonospora piscinae]TLW93145.1 hypothetical protein FFT09_06880 [Saccharomonospora piscinae]